MSKEKWCFGWPCDRPVASRMDDLQSDVTSFPVLPPIIWYKSVQVSGNAIKQGHESRVESGGVRMSQDISARAA